MQCLLVFRCAAYGELYAGAVFLLRVQDAGASAESFDAVDVESLVLDEFAHCLNLPCFESASQHGEHVAVLALSCHPCLVLVDGDGVESYVHSQFRCLEQQVLHHAARLLVFHSDEYSERECGVDVSLSDVLYVHVVLGEYSHNACGESRSVFAGDAEQHQFFVCHCHIIQCILIHSAKVDIFFRTL